MFRLQHSVIIHRMLRNVDASMAEKRRDRSISPRLTRIRQQYRSVHSERCLPQEEYK
jgi:hypothetical protein